MGGGQGYQAGTGSEGRWLRTSKVFAAVPHTSDDRRLTAEKSKTHISSFLSTAFRRLPSIIHGWRWSYALNQEDILIRAFFNGPPTVSSLTLDAQPKFSETILALQMAYASEIQAHLNYVRYAEKARLDNYPAIAHLFNSFATSESFHARNFKQVLSDLEEFKGLNSRNQKSRLAPRG